MNFPDDLLYTPDHEWIRVEDDKQTAYIGITDYAQSELGDIVYIEIDAEGEDLDGQAVFGTVEAVKTVSDLLMPVSGKVLEFNKDLESDPELVNKEPYGKGWLVKIGLKDTSQLEQLLSAEAYQEHLGI